MWIQQYCLAYFKLKKHSIKPDSWGIVLTPWSPRSPVVSCGATCIHLITCCLFGTERKNWAFSQLEVGSGAGWMLIMMAAVRSNECPSKRQDRLEHMKHYWLHPLLCKSILKYNRSGSVFLHKIKYKKYAMHIFGCHFIPPRMKPVAIIKMLICSQTESCCPTQSQTFSSRSCWLEFNSYQKYCPSEYY